MTAVANPTAVPSLTVGGRVFTDLANLITLYAFTTTALEYSCARKPTAAAGYTPSGAKKFVLHAAVNVTKATVADTSTVGYADNDLGVSSLAAPTNLVSLAGSGSIQPIGGVSQSGEQRQFGGLAFEVPNTKFLYVVGSAGPCQWVLYGYEV